MLKIGDKIKYVKANPCIEFPIGTIFTVTDIQYNTILIDGEYTVDGVVVGNIKGFMSYDEYQKYFEKYVEGNKEKPESNSQYTEWMKFDYCYNHSNCKNCPWYLLCSVQKNPQIIYKHNNKKIVLKATINNTTVYPETENKIITTCASCYKDDTFNLGDGLFVGMNKLTKKVAKQTIKRAEELIKNI